MGLRVLEQRTNEARRAIFRSLVSSSHDAWMLVDERGMVQTASRNWAALRYEPKHMSGQPAREFVRGLFGTDGGLLQSITAGAQVMVFDQPGVAVAQPDGSLVPAVVRVARVPTRTGWLVGVTVKVSRPNDTKKSEAPHGTVEKFRATAKDDELARGIGASARVAMRALEAQAFHLLRFTPGGLRVAHAIAPPRLMGNHEVVPDLLDSPQGQALRGGRAIVIADGRTVDPRPGWWPSEVVSALIVPLRVNGRIDGLVEIWSTSRRAFDADDIAFATAVADLMGASLDAFAWQSRVRAHREQLRQLSRRLMSVQESERRHLARELHDELGQVLTALKLEVSAALDGTQRTAKPRLQSALGMVDRMIAQVRSISLDLRPPGLDELGLAAALRWFAHQLRDRTGLDVQLSASPVIGRPPAEIEQACFRIVQEALTNVVRHAHARGVRVTVRQRVASLSLTVTDDGIGFDVDIAQSRGREGSSLGLIGMRERAELAGGRFNVRSQHGRGTTVSAQLSWSVALSAPRGTDTESAADRTVALASGSSNTGGHIE
jgi:signal transduction histidine kinase